MSNETAIFGAGCFWGVEAEFAKIAGVVATEVGYSGGTLRDPSYEDVCAGNTGHAEVVRVYYDQATVSYERLLTAFWQCHDPTTPNRQGPDRGSQYRSVVFCVSPEQLAAAQSSKAELNQSGRYQDPIATQIERASEFWRAEEYHQQYLARRGRDSCSM